MGPKVQIYTVDHNHHSYIKPVVIEDNVFVDEGSIINYGVPAKKIRTFDKD